MMRSGFQRDRDPGRRVLILWMQVRWIIQFSPVLSLCSENRLKSGVILWPSSLNLPDLCEVCACHTRNKADANRY